MIKAKISILRDIDDYPYNVMHSITERAFKHLTQEFNYSIDFLDLSKFVKNFYNENVDEIEGLSHMQYVIEYFTGTMTVADLEVKLNKNNLGIKMNKAINDAALMVTMNILNNNLERVFDLDSEFHAGLRMCTFGKGNANYIIRLDNSLTKTVKALEIGSTYRDLIDSLCDELNCRYGDILVTPVDTLVALMVRRWNVVINGKGLGCRYAAVLTYLFKKCLTLNKVKRGRVMKINIDLDELKHIHRKNNKGITISTAEYDRLMVMNTYKRLKDAESRS